MYESLNAFLVSLVNNLKTFWDILENAYISIKTPNLKHIKLSKLTEVKYQKMPKTTLKGPNILKFIKKCLNILWFSGYSYWKWIIWFNKIRLSFHIID